MTQPLQFTTVRPTMVRYNFVSVICRNGMRSTLSSEGLGRGGLMARRGRKAVARLVSALLACSVLVPGTLLAREVPHKRVLLLHSYGPNFAPFKEYASGLRKELTRLSPTPVEFFEASLESARFPATRTEAPLAEYLSVLFDESGFDVVISLGGPAARFCLIYGSRIFPSVPLVVAGLERRLLGDEVPAHVVFSAVAVDIPGIRREHPTRASGDDRYRRDQHRFRSR